MAHINVPLPRCVSPGSEARPETVVDVLRNPAGYDVRIQRRSEPLRRFVVTYNIRNLTDLYDILEHFHAAEGPLNTFPMLDRTDWKSCGPHDEPTALDAFLGDGDGGTAAFQLRKSYTRGSTTVYRTILLPITDSVLVAVDGVVKTVTTHYTVDYLTGIITFTGGNIPGSGSEVTAGFRYYCKVRFDGNDLGATYEGFRVGQSPQVTCIEVRQ